MLSVTNRDCVYMIKQRVIGHRGLAGKAPENTAASIRLAKQKGLEWIELDVTQTADLQLVMFHDERIDRCCDGRGNLAELSLAELQTLDFGSWFSPSFAGETILTLEQALTLVQQNGLKLNLELKVHPELPWQMLVSDTALMLDRFNLDPSNLLVSSFYRETLIAFHEARPEYPTGILLEEPIEQWQHWAAEVDAVSVHCGHEQLTDEFINQVLEQQFLLMAYTVNDPETFLTLRAKGVHAVFSDHADELLSVASQ